MPEYCTCDVVLSNSMARPMKLRCCVFNKVFLVNHWHNIQLQMVMFSKTLIDAYVENNDFYFTLNFINIVIMTVVYILPSYAILRMGIFTSIYNYVDEIYGLCILAICYKSSVVCSRISGIWCYLEKYIVHTN